MEISFGFRKLIMWKRWTYLDRHSQYIHIGRNGNRNNLNTKLVIDVVCSSAVRAYHITDLSVNCCHLLTTFSLNHESPLEYMMDSFEFYFAESTFIDLQSTVVKFLYWWYTCIFIGIYKSRTNDFLNLYSIQ